MKRMRTRHMPTKLDTNKMDKKLDEVLKKEAKENLVEFLRRKKNDSRV